MGIVQKVNNNGYYQNFDTETNQFVGEPLRPYQMQAGREVVPSNKTIDSEIANTVSLVDQTPHQTIVTEDGQIIDLEEKHFSIIDEDGRIEFDADGQTLISIAKEELTYGNFIKTYKDSSKQAMLMLLALQSNTAPLKRGGLDIGYMADILVDHMIVHFSEEANIIWEALSAIQSSRPEDSMFSITAADLKPYTNYASDEALYHALKKGAEELKHTNLEFDIPDPEHDGHNIMIHWNDGAEWVGNNRKTGEKAHFDVYTNDFYRVLMSSSGILHGAHWNRRISRSLKGYARALYLFCARNKNYTKYKGAVPGVKELSVEETRYELKINEKEGRYIWRNLTRAMEQVNSLDGSEFSVTIKRVPEKGKIQGFRFDIKENRFIDAASNEIEERVALPLEETVTDPFEEQVKSFLKLSGASFTDEELDRIYQISKKFNRDAGFMMQAAGVLKTRLDNNSMDKIESPIAYLITLIKNGSLMDAAALEKDYNTTKKSFSNYKGQRDYDWDELEKKLIGH